MTDEPEIGLVVTTGARNRLPPGESDQEEELVDSLLLVQAQSDRTSASTSITTGEVVVQGAPLGSVGQVEQAGGGGKGPEGGGPESWRALALSKGVVARRRRGGPWR